MRFVEGVLREGIVSDRPVSIVSVTVEKDLEKGENLNTEENVHSEITEMPHTTPRMGRVIDPRHLMLSKSQLSEEKYPVAGKCL